ncbi:hypothetical protein ABPG77_006360 [Micractinium sp. CCAP 211/92]
MQCALQLAAAPAAAARASTRGRQQAGAARRAVAARAARVELQDLDGTMHILEVGEDETVLDVALDKGLDMPYDCKMGVCLRCSAKIESGDVEQPGGMISEESQAQGYALMCVAFPKSDCKIRVIPEDELVDAIMEIA